MEEILERANELGLLIQSTSVYCRYRDMAEAIEGDPGAKKLLSEYESMAKDIELRQKNGDIVEKFEIEALKELVRKAGEHAAIVGYLEAKVAYAGLLETIQNALLDESGA